MKKFFSTKVLVTLLAILGITALILRSQTDEDIHTYPLNESMKLLRLDYFSHYQLVDSNDVLIIDKVTSIGMNDSYYLFFNELGEALVYNREDNSLSELPASEIENYSDVERYKPWSFTDSLNNQDNVRFALKLVYMAMIVLLAALLSNWVKGRKKKSQEGDI